MDQHNKSWIAEHRFGENHGLSGSKCCPGRDGRHNNFMISAGNLLGEGSICMTSQQGVIYKVDEEYLP